MVQLRFHISGPLDPKALQLRLGKLLDHDAHVDAAELSPSGEACVQFHAADLDVREINEYRKWLATLPDVSGIEVSIVPDPTPPA